MSTRILSANTSDEATLTSPDFLVGLPVTNLQVEGRGSVARTANAAGSKVINGNLASASVVSACILYGHNLSSQSLMRLQVYDQPNQVGTRLVTNLILQSENISAWNSDSQVPVVIPDTTIAPDGLVTMDTLAAKGGYVYQFFTTPVSANGKYTVSIFSRSATPHTDTNGIAFSLFSTPGIDIRGVVTLPNGFYRHWVTRTFLSDYAAAFIVLILRPTLIDEPFWGGQLNAGELGIYVKTAAASASAYEPVYDSWYIPAVPPIGWGDFLWGLPPWGANIFTGWGRAFTDLWFLPTAGLSFRITLNDTSNPDGYIQVNRLLLGPYFEPGVNVSYGLNVQWDTNDEQIRTQGGSLRTDNKVLFRTVRGQFGHLTPGERSVFMDILRRIGKRTETFVSIWPEVGGALERDNAVLGKFTQMPDLTNQTPSSYSSQLVFEEV